MLCSIIGHKLNVYIVYDAKIMTFLKLRIIYGKVGV